MLPTTQMTAQSAPSYMSSDMVAQPVAHGTGSAAAANVSSDASLSGSRTPPKIRRTRSTDARTTATATTKRRGAAKAPRRAISAGPRFRIDVSPGTAKATQQRVDVPDHVFVASADSTPDAQLAALVKQQKLDHAHFEAIHAMLKNLCKYAVHQEADLQNTNDAALMMRRELFSVRDSLSSELERSIGKIRDETALQTGHRLASLEASVLALQASSAASADCTRRMAMYLEGLDGARPQEGNELASGFQRVIGEIHLVRERVRQFEQMTAAAGVADAAGPPGIATSQAHAKMLDEITKKIKNMEEVFNLADNSLLAYTSSQAARIDESCAAAAAVQDGRIAVLEQVSTQLMGSLDSMRTFQEGLYSGGAPLPPALHYGSYGGSQRASGGFPAGGGLRGAYGSAGGCCGGEPGHPHGREPPRTQDGPDGVEECHCDHVKELMVDVAALKAAAAGSAGDDPWARARTPRSHNIQG